MSNLRQTSLRSLSVRFSSGHIVPWHHHAWAQLIYATDGTMRVEVQSEVWIVPTNRAIWVPSSHEHQIKMHGSVHLQTIYTPESLVGNDVPQRCEVLEVVPLLRELVIEICHRSVIEPDSTENQTLIQFFHHQLKRAESVPLSIPMPLDPRARKFAETLLSNSDQSLGYSETAKNSGASLRTVQRLFQNELGLSIQQWKTRARMLAAIESLSQQKSVTQIALDLGFESASAFIYAFRTYFGITPGQFRSKGFAKEKAHPKATKPFNSSNSVR